MNRAAGTAEGVLWFVVTLGLVTLTLIPTEAWGQERVRTEREEVVPAGPSVSLGEEAEELVAGHGATFDRTDALLIGLTIFVLAVFVGFEVISKVPTTLHTPLMSGSNAISGITVVGAIIVGAFALKSFSAFLGFLAIVLAMINVVGGFMVTHRMLSMFRRR